MFILNPNTNSQSPSDAFQCENADRKYFPTVFLSCLPPKRKHFVNETWMSLKTPPERSSKKKRTKGVRKCFYYSFMVLFHGFYDRWRCFVSKTVVKFIRGILGTTSVVSNMWMVMATRGIEGQTIKITSTTKIPIFILFLFFYFYYRL